MEPGEAARFSMDDAPFEISAGSFLSICIHSNGTSDSLTDVAAIRLAAALPSMCQEFEAVIEELAAGEAGVVAADPNANEPMKKHQALPSYAMSQRVAQEAPPAAARSSTSALPPPGGSATFERESSALSGSSANRKLSSEGSRAILEAAAAAWACTRIKLLGLDELGLSCADAFEPMSRHGKLETIVVLALVRCGLTDTLPTAVTQCPKLEELVLSKNRISGRIPYSIGACSSLQSLILSQNQLSGPIPSAIAIPTLQVLELQENKLTGSIPESIKRCSKLQRLVLHSNGLSGNLPTELPKTLERIVLFKNNLTGLIPETIGECTQLLALALYQNQFSGTIPDSLGKCTKLQVLGLYQNELQGQVPWEAISKLRSLRKLGLHANAGLSITPQGKRELEQGMKQCKKWYPKIMEDKTKETGGRMRLSTSPTLRASISPVRSTLLRASSVMSKIRSSVPEKAQHASPSASPQGAGGGMGGTLFGMFAIGQNKGWVSPQATSPRT
jgi:hypothetical protein